MLFFFSPSPSSFLPVLLLFLLFLLLILLILLICFLSFFLPSFLPSFLSFFLSFFLSVSLSLSLSFFLSCLLACLLSFVLSFFLSLFRSFFLSSFFFCFFSCFLFVLSILSKPYILLPGQWLHRKMLAIHIPQTFSQHKRLDLSGERCIIFADTTREARTLLSHPALGHRAKAVHNESSPHDRDRTLTAFANLEPLVTFCCTLSNFRFGNLDHSTGFGIQPHHQIWAVYEES